MNNTNQAITKISAIRNLLSELQDKADEDFGIDTRNVSDEQNEELNIVLRILTLTQFYTTTSFIGILNEDKQ